MKNKLLIIIMMIISSYNLYSQGCSDAGLCTIQMNHDDKASSLNYNYSIGLGLSSNNVLINSYKMTLFYSPLDKVTIFAGLPFSIINGNLGTQTGVGDIDFGIQYALHLENEHLIKYSMSLKSSLDREERYTIFPSGIAEPLPMVYHPSLGNDNLIIVIDYLFDKWEISGGVLIPFTQPNNNMFITNSDLDNSIVPYIFDEYLTSAGLERSEDVMIRAKREVYKTDKFTVKAGINPIYRLSNNIVNFIENGVDKSFEIEGSGGLTLNIIGDINYQLSESTFLTFAIGIPTIARQNQNDGLLRMFQANLSISGSIF